MPVERFIPAGAGNSGFRASLTPLIAVYPRRCGEQKQRDFLPGGLLGLSPQVRGTVAKPGQAVGLIRFIPAGAGNRPGKRTRGQPPTVYPRRCGEQIGASAGPRHENGLSPQVRGTGPAAARTPVPPTVYPRRCGEQNWSSRRPATSLGLSPQVRGTVPRVKPVFFSSRFIPAGAGNSVAPNDNGKG